MTSLNSCRSLSAADADITFPTAQTNIGLKRPTPARPDQYLACIDFFLRGVKKFSITPPDCPARCGLFAWVQFGKLLLLPSLSQH